MSLGPNKPTQIVETLAVLENVVRGFAREYREIAMSGSRHRVFSSISSRRIFRGCFREGSAGRSFDPSTEAATAASARTGSSSHRL